MELVKLHPLFGLEIRHVNVAAPMAESIFSAIRAALEEQALLLFRDQQIDDDAQIAFSRRFGPLETTISANPAGGTLFARQSNLDMATHEVIPPDDPRMIYQKANLLWHSDSSFKPVPAFCSLLSARLVPREGGDTEFADMRAAYEALPEATKHRLEGLVAEHSLAHSRAQVDPTVLTAAQKAEAPPVKQVMVRVSPVTGRKSLFIGAHCGRVVGWPEEEGRSFVRHLMEISIKPEFCYVHRWRDGDLVVWDNRCLLHRATPYDGARYQRLMQRTTVAGDGPTVPQYR